MIVSLRARREQLLQEVAGNRRLQAGLAAIAVITAVYVFLVLVDLHGVQSREYSARTQQLAKMRALAGQDAWIGRAQSVARVRRGLDAEIPRVETVGVAQAQLMTWVRDMGQSSGGDAVQIQSQEPQRVVADGDVWRIPVVITGAAPPDKVVQMIQQVEQRSVLTVVEQALIVNRENRTYSLTLVAFARIGEGSADAAP
jgi:hypothetical protein